MRSHSTTQPTPNSQYVDSRMQTDVSVNIFIGCSIAILMIVFAGFNIYKKQRAAVLRQQVASLEKLWHLNIKKKRA
jgi:H+/gluconate symporter-like permease